MRQTRELFITKAGFSHQWAAVTGFSGLFTRRGRRHEVGTGLVRGGGVRWRGSHFIVHVYEILKEYGQPKNKELTALAEPFLALKS